MCSSGGSETITLMDGAHRTIAIHDVDAGVVAPHCGACLHDPARAPVCRAVADAAGQAPQLSGPADQVARLMAALAAALGCAPDGAGLVRSLCLQPGEVELRLAVPPASAWASHHRRRPGPHITAPSCQGTNSFWP